MHPDEWLPTGLLTTCRLYCGLAHAANPSHHGTGPSMDTSAHSGHSQCRTDARRPQPSLARQHPTPFCWRAAITLPLPAPLAQ